MLMQKNKMRGRNLGPQLGLFVQLNIRVPWKSPGRGTTNNFVVIQKKKISPKVYLFLYPLKICGFLIFLERPVA